MALIKEKKHSLRNRGRIARLRKRLLVLAVVVVGLSLFIGCFADMTQRSVAPPRDIPPTPVLESVLREEKALAVEAEPPLENLGDEMKLKQLEETTPFEGDGTPALSDLEPQLFQVRQGEIYVDGAGGDKVFLTLEPTLQQQAEEILSRYKVPWGALVAIDPATGKVLTLASYSTSKDNQSRNLSLQATFPAASLFKVVTAAAAIEYAGLTADDQIHYRGGDYTLTPRNYLPDERHDKRRMTVRDALARSCNPAFARIALLNLTPSVLHNYASSFGFNMNLPFELEVEQSSFTLPMDDFAIARTAAGFGDVTISPLHAAMISGALANQGKLMRPYIVDRVVDPTGYQKYFGRPLILRQAILDSTATALAEMLVATVTNGTARKHFTRSRQKALRNISVSAKTGTLRGDNPPGVYHWFIASAPLESPEVAIAALVIDPGSARVSASGIGRMFLEHFFSHRPQGSDQKVGL